MLMTIYWISVILCIAISIYVFRIMHTTGNNINIGPLVLAILISFCPVVNAIVVLFSALPVIAIVWNTAIIKGKVKKK